MKFLVKPSSLQGCASIPASKSHTIRSVFIASLSEGESRIINPLTSADGLSALSACRELGAEVRVGEDWVITGKGPDSLSSGKTIDVGNSGTTARFITGMAALSQGEVTITGDEQTRKRPMESLLAALRSLGAKIHSVNSDGRLPIRIQGPISGGHTEVSGVTSQFISSLLINCPLASGDTTIDVPSLNERPYVEMTLKWLDSQNIQYENDNFKRFFIKGNQKYTPINRRVPADFSSATFFLCAASCTESSILLQGLD
ncbi:MAG: 3-phosphoshikimate 1-carboxyvinyltransferase, partial [Nitrospinota bacterium]